jgi:hypothetical protein
LQLPACDKDFLRRKHLPVVLSIAGCHILQERILARLYWDHGKRSKSSIIRFQDCSGLSDGSLLPLTFWRGVLALVIWPYYMGVEVKLLVR